MRHTPLCATYASPRDVEATAASRGSDEDGGAGSSTAIYTKRRPESVCVGLCHSARGKKPGMLRGGIRDAERRKMSAGKSNAEARTGVVIAKRRAMN